MFLLRASPGRLLMVLEAFGIKISLKVSKTVNIQTLLLEIVVFPGKKTPEAAFFGSHMLVCSQDICCVCSQDICIVSSQDICIVSSEDICIEDICILSHLNVTNHNMHADVLAADNADVLAADTTDVLAADKYVTSEEGGLRRFFAGKNDDP